MISVVLTCAGNGTRFGKNKILSQINGKTVLEMTVSQFQKSKKIDEIIVVAKKHDFKIYRDILKKRGLKARLVEGGKERIISAYNGVKAAKGEIVIIHDGVRPLTPVWLIDKVAETSKKYRAVIPAVTPTTTIKYAREDLLIKKSLSRVETWLSQTPQGFRRELILRAYKKAIEERCFTPTDDSELVTKLGEEVRIVQGDYCNIKITFPLDLAIAERLIEFIEKGEKNV